jgi:hypothetical protein
MSTVVNAPYHTLPYIQALLLPAKPEIDKLGLQNSEKASNLKAITSQTPGMFLAYWFCFVFRISIFGFQAKEWARSGPVNFSS